MENKPTTVTDPDTFPNSHTTSQIPPGRKISNFIPDIGNIVNVVIKKDVIVESHSGNNSFCKEEQRHNYGTNATLANLKKINLEEPTNYNFLNEVNTPNLTETPTPMGRKIINDIHHIISDTPESRSNFRNNLYSNKEVMSNTNSNRNTPFSININNHGTIIEKEKETNFSIACKRNKKRCNFDEDYYDYKKHQTYAGDEQTPIENDKLTKLNPFIQIEPEIQEEDDQMPIMKTKTFNNLTPSIINMTNNCYNFNGNMQMMTNDPMLYDNCNMKMKMNGGGGGGGGGGSNMVFNDEGINYVPQRSMSSQMLQQNTFGNNYFEKNNFHTSTNQWNNQPIQYNMNNLANDFGFMTIQPQQQYMQQQQQQYMQQQQYQGMQPQQQFMQQQQSQQYQQYQPQNNLGMYGMNNANNYNMYGNNQGMNIQAQHQHQGQHQQQTQTQTQVSMNKGSNYKSPKKKNRQSTVNYTIMPVSELIENLNTVSKDQAGCRQLQRILNDQPEFASIFITKAFENLLEIITDSFGNYLIQKLFQYMNEDKLLQLMALLKITIFQVCMNAYGTRSIQTLIDYLNTDVLMMNFILIIKPFIMDLILDINGSHIILKLLDNTTQSINPLIEEICKNVVGITTHKHGCCVLQKCLEKIQSNHKDMIIKAIVDNSQELIIDQCGNYMIQYIIKLDNEAINERIVMVLSEDILSYSKQKHSSNVVENCLDKCSDQTCSIIIAQMKNEKIIVELLFDKYGNYVFQKALSRADDMMRQYILEAIAPHLPNLKNYSFGLKLYSKLVLMYPEVGKMMIGNDNDNDIAAYDDTNEGNNDKGE